MIAASRIYFFRPPVVETSGIQPCPNKAHQPGRASTIAAGSGTAATRHAAPARSRRPEGRALGRRGQLAIRIPVAGGPGGITNDCVLVLARLQDRHQVKVIE